MSTHEFTLPLPPFLVEADGEIRLTASRIGLAHVVRSYRRGNSAEMIALEFPTLPLAQVHTVLGFYLENRAAVDDYVRQADTELARRRAESPAPSADELRARLQARNPFARRA